MLTATRPLSILDNTFDRGEEIPQAVADRLPVGRLEQLIATRRVARREDELREQVVLLQEQVSRLQAQVALLSGHGCDECEYVGSSEHALKVHRGRSHKES